MPRKHGKLIELNPQSRLVKDGPAVLETDESLRRGKAVWNGPRPAKNKRPQLVPVWNDPNMGQAIRSHARPADYQHPPEVSDELIEALSSGQPIAARHDLVVGQDKGVYPFFPLERFRGQPGTPAPIPRGSILAYAGIVRTTERKWLDGVDRFGNTRTADVQVFKHTFITPLGRCIIHDFGLICPA